MCTALRAIKNGSAREAVIVTGSLFHFHITSLQPYSLFNYHTFLVLRLRFAVLCSRYIVCSCVYAFYIIEVLCKCENLCGCGRRQLSR